MTEDQNLLSALAKAVFRLNGQFLAIGEELARPAALTASSWLLLSTVLGAGRTVADIARDIGVTRQSAQRTADLLVADGHAEYRPNPAHRRAKLLVATDAGRAAVRRIGPSHRAYADRFAREIGRDSAAMALETLRRLSDALHRTGMPDRPEAGR